MVVMVSNSLSTLLFQALLPGMLARMILEVRCPRLPWFLFEGLLARMILEVRCPRDEVVVMAFLLLPVLLLAMDVSGSAGENDSGGKVSARRCGATLQALLESHVFTLDEPTQRMRPQVRVKESLDCLMSSESEFPPLPNSSHAHNSCHRLSTSACARASWSAAACAGAVARVCPVSSSSAESAVVHAHATTLHNAQNSWSDTGRVKGPTGRRCTKGGVSGPAEDLRPVSEVGDRGKFSAGRRCTGAGLQVHFPGRQPGTGTRQVRGGVDTPSLHPEVSGIQFVSPGRGLDIRQSMGWTKVCETTRSGIWVLKGNARARMLPENLDHLRVRWISRGTYETAWVTPGHDCLCSYKYGHGAAVRPQTNNAIWDGVIGFWGRVAPLLSPWVWQEGIANGYELEPVLRSKFMYSLA